MHVLNPVRRLAVIVKHGKSSSQSVKIERCSVPEACIFFGGSEKLLSELRDKLKDWLKLQPHLPQDCSRQELEWMILNTKFSAEKAKQKLDMYYTIRSLVPELYRDRDPRKLTSATINGQFVVLPKLTPEKYRVVLGRFVDSDASTYQPWDAAKYIFMLYDTLINQGDHAYGLHAVFDLSMMSLGHLLKITPVHLKKWEITFSKAYASSLKGIHFINVRPHLARLITMTKTVMTKKMSERVHAHPAGNLESLYRLIPRSVLPKDYGGDEPTMDELAARGCDGMEKWRDWFLEQENVLVNERLRPGSALDKDSLFGFSGSFRKLDVD